jgi:hypothetical protein
MVGPRSAHEDNDISLSVTAVIRVSCRLQTRRVAGVRVVSFSCCGRDSSFGAEHRTKAAVVVVVVVVVAVLHACARAAACGSFRYSMACLIACIFNRSVVPYPSMDERVVMVKVRKRESVCDFFVRAGGGGGGG